MEVKHEFFQWALNLVEAPAPKPPTLTERIIPKVFIYSEAQRPSKMECLIKLANLPIGGSLDLPITPVLYRGVSQPYRKWLQLLRDSHKYSFETRIDNELQVIVIKRVK